MASRDIRAEKRKLTKCSNSISDELALLAIEYKAILDHIKVDYESGEQILQDLLPKTQVVFDLLCDYEAKLAECDKQTYALKIQAENYQQLYTNERNKSLKLQNQNFELVNANSPEGELPSSPGVTTTQIQDYERNINTLKVELKNTKAKIHTINSHYQTKLKEKMAGTDYVIGDFYLEQGHNPLQFFQNCEIVFKHREGITEEAKLEFVRLKLKGKAWEILQLFKGTTFAEFKTFLTERTIKTKGNFLEAQIAFSSIKQLETESLIEYRDRFAKLAGLVLPKILNDDANWENVTQEYQKLMFVQGLYSQFMRQKADEFGSLQFSELFKKLKLAENSVLLENKSENNKLDLSTISDELVAILEKKLSKRESAKAQMPAQVMPIYTPIPVQSPIEHKKEILYMGPQQYHNGNSFNRGVVRRNNGGNFGRGRDRNSGQYQQNSYGYDNNRGFQSNNRRENQYPPKYQERYRGRSPNRDYFSRDRDLQRGRSESPSRNYYDYDDRRGRDMSRGRSNSRSRDYSNERSYRDSRQNSRERQNYADNRGLPQADNQNRSRDNSKERNDKNFQ